MRGDTDIEGRDERDASGRQIAKEKVIQVAENGKAKGHRRLARGDTVILRGR